MIMPVRLQLRRAKGFSLQAVSQARNGLPAVKVDRSTPWGNPFIPGQEHPWIPGLLVQSTRHAVQLYAAHAAANPTLLALANPGLAAEERLSRHGGRVASTPSPLPPKASPAPHPPARAPRRARPWLD